jgi:hypothetical protein
MKYTYQTIQGNAERCKKTVEKEYKTGVSDDWAYYFAKLIINPKKDVTKITMKQASNRQQDPISRGITKKDYTEMAKRYVNYVEKNKQIPNYLTYKDIKISPALLKTFFAKIIVNNYPATQNINSKWFTKPSEQHNEVYDYFVKVFGKFDNTIDGALAKVDGRGYAYYYGDVYSNKQSIDRLKSGKGINCTDSCHVFYNIMLQLIKFGKYKKVECLHVMCSSGGHVKLRITMNDGTKIIRDPACCISDNGKGIRCVWCTNTPIAVNPSWFMQNLNR